ncbi:MAG: S8 family serine peptidase [Ectothiorhodospiraceae bacterium]|nr:S8 family serine peptidase [Ectothiorhodospiraceae bacterium]
MSKNYVMMAVLLVGLTFVAPTLARVGQVQTPAGAYDGILVKFKSGVSQTRINRAFNSAGSTQHRGFRSRLVRGLTRAEVGRGRSMSSTLRSLRRNRDVEFAEPNYILTAYAVPNDSQFTSLWGLNNTGQTGGVADADIDAPEAWDLQVGSNVIIAVIDSGTDYNHRDLSNNIWNNTGEIPNNGRDDDGNGYVDDVRGWDFANNDNDPMDDNGHGTHVSGTIAASGNNGTGVVGVNWFAQIMPLKFLSDVGAGSSADAIAAIDYAVANGARVINASWGGGPYSSAMFRAIQAANNAGVLFVAAAGNDGTNNDRNSSYPADYDLPNVISVAATDASDNLASFSNYGANSVDLGAPGVRILSTSPGNRYSTFSGTSMASPHVAGVAGLVVANNPGIGITELRAALLDGTDAIRSLSGRTVSGGRLNAYLALGGGTAPPPPPPTPVVTIAPGSQSVIVGNSVRFTASGGTGPYVWSVANATIGSISANGTFTAFARGVTQVNATDANGVRSGSASVTVNDTAALAVTPNTANVSVGQTLRFNASGGSAPYSWRSNNTSVAIIDPISGVLTGQSAGNTTVSVTDNANRTVTSGRITVTAVSVSPSTATLTVSNTRQFSAGGGVAPYSWSSSNSSVASINTSGRLTANSAGTTVVTAIDANGSRGSSSTITVNAAPVNISVSPSSGSVVVGSTLRFTASGGRAPYSWVVSNGSVARIDSNGTLTGLAAGSVIITARDANGVTGSSSSVTVTSSNAGGGGGGGFGHGRGRGRGGRGGMMGGRGNSRSYSSNSGWR